MHPVLHVRIRHDGGPVILRELHELTKHLQSTLTAVSRDLSDLQDAHIDYEITHAETGSLALGLRPIPPDKDRIDPHRVLETFTHDIEDIQANRFRASMTPRLTQKYHSLIRTVSAEDAVVEYRYKQCSIAVDSAFRARFDVALKERVAEDVQIVGHLDALDAHRKSYRFYLYPKFVVQGRIEWRIECRFPTALLSQIVGLIKKTVKVRGKGFFAPVGLYPLRVESTEAPVPLNCDADLLRSYVRKMNLVPSDMTVAEYLQRNREAAGFAD